MARKELVRLVLLLLAAAALVAGCGGDDDDTTEATGAEPDTALSDDEYRQQLLEVLTPLGQELQQITAEAQDEQSLDQAATSLGEVRDVVRRAIDGVERIEAPDQFQAPQERLIAALEQFEQATADAQRAAESGDRQAIVEDYPAAATQLQQELSEVVQDYQEAGLEVQAPTSP